MGLRDLTKQSVLKAIDEYEHLGRTEFLEKYEYGRARDYILSYRGRYYDSKAIAGAAHGYLDGQSPLLFSDFSGGNATVKNALEQLGFEVTSPQTPVGMNTNPGDKISNYELVWRFGVGNMGGMRRNARRQHLVLVSDPTKSLYDDRWEGKVLHYTGMGKIGDQSITQSQNRTLAESTTSNETVHLFEVFEPGEYTYVGIVELEATPYQEVQLDDKSNERKVWMFPLGVTSKAKINLPSHSQVTAISDNRRKKVESLSTASLKRFAQASSKKTSPRDVTTKQYPRSEFIAEYTKRMANGVCDLCRSIAPFKTKKGKPYLENHHIVWLSKDGVDDISNAVALCPNCHRKMHSLNAKADREKLLSRVKERDQGISDSNG
jgi:5-methylcytosine-specific restriction enzyme A